MIFLDYWFLVLYILFQIESSVTETFTSLAQRYYGTTRDQLIDDAIDYVQKTVSIQKPIEHWI